LAAAVVFCQVTEDVVIQTRGNRLCLALLLSGACLPAFAADPEVKAGGVTLALPGPANDFAEVGDKLKTTFFELLVPSTNRLLSAYLPTQRLAELNSGKAPGPFDVYAMVEVLRQAEYVDCTPEAFEEVLKGSASSLGELDGKKVGDLEQELNIHLKALGTKPVELGRPEMLGAIFQKSNAAGFAMLTAVKQGDRNVTLAGGFALLRLKQRLIFAYLYHTYESPDTVTWLRKNLETWCDAILAKNN
jgi:hypothetical protein